MQDKRQEQMEKLAKLLSGNATEQERAAAKGENGEELEKAKKLWDKTGAMDEWEPDTDKAWQRFSVKAMAREQQIPAMPEHNAKSAVGEPQPNTRVRKLRPVSNLRWWGAAAVLLLLLGVWVVWQTPEETEMLQIATAANEKQEVLLPDGSKVWLNENSTLAYAKGFSVDDRRVELSGEAFFEVQKAEGKRFTIVAGGTITEVIGTSFNVNAYSQQPVTVQVVTGRVAFADAQKEEAVFLGPGEQATFGGTAVAGGTAAEVQKQEISDPNFRAWQSGELHFANTSLEQLSHTLSDYFDEDVQLQNPGLSNCRFTATFENPSLEEVLEVLRLTGNFTITQTQKGYLISGQGCQ